MKEPNKYCLFLDLKEDPALIAAYEAYHQSVWPEVLQSIKEAGIIKMDIYRYHNRLVMFMETSDTFSFEQKNEADARNKKVQEWEQLMWKYQQALPGAKEGSKWQLAHSVFSFQAEQ